MTQLFSKIWIFVILIIISVGGILAWQYFVVPAETKDETANWKTTKYYGPEKAVFEIKYPRNWEVLDEGITPNVYISPKGDTRGIQVTVQPIYRLEDFQIQSLEKVNIKGRDFHKREVVNVNYKVTQYIFIDKYNRALISLSIPNQERPDAYYVSDSEITSLQNIFNQMLSTFKFLE